MKAKGYKSKMRVQTIEIVAACLLGASLLSCYLTSWTAEGGVVRQSRNLLGFWDDQHPDAKTPFAWTPRNIIAIPAACLCALLANSAGIGGGPFYIPLMNVVVGFSLQQCVGLSHTIVSTSAIASALYGLTHTRPGYPDRPLVDLDVALIFIPALLFGTSVGVICSNIIPSWLRVVSLVLLLLVVVYKTGKKGHRQWNEENKQRQAVASPEQSPAKLPGGEEEDFVDDGSTKGGVLHEEQFHEIKMPGDGNGNNDGEDPEPAHAPAATPDSPDAGLIAALKTVSWWQVGMLLSLWIVFLAFQLEKSKYGHCSKQFLGIFAAQAVFCISLTVYFIRHELAELGKPAGLSHEDPEMHELLVGERSGVPPGERRPMKVLMIAMLVFALSGASAGLLGIGGALIFNPYLLQLGMDPRVVAPTSVVMILFSSSTIALSYFFSGELNTQYAWVFSPICFVAALIGVTLIGRIVRKSGRASLLIFILTGLIAVGTVLSAAFGGRTAYIDIRDGKNIGFGSFC